MANTDFKSQVPPLADVVEVFRIPNPASDEHVTLYTEIRLSTLFTNPEEFNSTYAGGCAFSREQWGDRVDTPGRATLVASFPSSSTRIASPTKFDPPPPPSTQLPSETKWLGTLSILAPLTHSSHAYPPGVADAERQGTAEVWFLVGVWVRPEARGKGVGRMLIDNAVEFVRSAENASSGFMDGDRGAPRRKDRIILLGVFDHNIAAQKLYASAGFVKEDDTDAGRADDLKSALGVEVPAKSKRRVIWMMLTIQR